MNPIIYRSTRMVTDKLSNEELATLHLLAASGWPATGEEVGYEKWSPLLTQESNTKMHAETIAALEKIVAERLG